MIAALFLCLFLLTSHEQFYVAESAAVRYIERTLQQWYNPC